MYGIVHVELQHFIQIRYGRSVWADALKHAGLKNRIYMAIGTYLDAEVDAILEATAALTETPVTRLYEDFGAFLVQPMLSTYAPLINPDWRLMDLLLNLEEAVYRVIRSRSPGAQPPRVQAQRTGPHQIHLRYASPRRLPILARGFVLGAAVHYGEAVEIEDREGPDGEYEMTIRFLPGTLA